MKEKKVISVKFPYKKNTCNDILRQVGYSDEHWDYGHLSKEKEESFGIQ